MKIDGFFILFFVIVTFFGALAQLLLKLALDGKLDSLSQLLPVIQENWGYFIPGVICYGLAFVGYLFLVSKMRIHVLYPLQVALSFFLYICCPSLYSKRQYC